MSDETVFVVVLVACVAGALLAVAFLVAALGVSGRESEREEERGR